MNCFFEVNDSGQCDGVGGKDMEHIYRQCTKIARSILHILLLCYEKILMSSFCKIYCRVLMKMVDGDSCLTKTSDKVR